LVFFFIEKDAARFHNLEERLAELKLPANFTVRKECDSFEGAFGQVLAEIEEQSKRLEPAFIFIDPFGPTGFSMNLVARIAKQERSEVLITFNYQGLNQWFLQDESKHKHLDALYGSEVWKSALAVGDAHEREASLRNAYQKNLENLGWRVRPFRMVNKHNQTAYYLFFATRHALGMLAMKRAMWKSAPAGDFHYICLSY